jgi:hypothetical protein
LLLHIYIINLSKGGPPRVGEVEASQNEGKSGDNEELFRGIARVDTSPRMWYTGKYNATFAE